MAKFYIDDHNNISGDHYVDSFGNNVNDRLVNDMDIKNYSDKIASKSIGDTLVKIQNGINNGDNCVLHILFCNEMNVDDKACNHECDQCILKHINDRIHNHNG
jgi:NDP-sugar pyrophosphorylase family protein